MGKPLPPPTMLVEDKDPDVVVSLIDRDGFRVVLQLSPDMADEAARQLAAAARRVRGRAA